MNELLEVVGGNQPFLAMLDVADFFGTGQLPHLTDGYGKHLRSGFQVNEQRC